MTTKLPKISRPYWSGDPRTVRLEEGVEAKWCVVEVRSRDVETELQRRHFGIYVPELTETSVRRGRKVERRLPIFPGYVFVFLWETGANFGRLAGVEGVTAIIGIITDEQIDKIRYLENCERPVTLQEFEETIFLPAKTHKKRRWRKSRKPVKVTVLDEVVAVRAWSAWDDGIVNLDSEGRNQALREYVSS